MKQICIFFKQTIQGSLQGNTQSPIGYTLFMNTVFLAIQVYGLFFLKWGGLYSILLLWTDLLLLTIYNAIRFWRAINSKQWQESKRFQDVPTDRKAAIDHFWFVLLVRISYLLFFLFIINVSLIPFEFTKIIDGKAYAIYWSKSQFNDFLMHFILAVAVLVYCYSKLLFKKLDLSEFGLKELKANFVTLDLRYFIYILIGVTMPACLISGLIFGINTTFDDNSPSYLIAINIGFLRYVSEWIHLYIVHEKIKEPINDF
jgi:hypothetical protein